MRFDFTKQEYDKIVEEAMLKNDELLLDKILEMEIKHYSITKMSLELGLAESTISKRINILKKRIMKVI